MRRKKLYGELRALCGLCAALALCGASARAEAGGAAPTPGSGETVQVADCDGPVLTPGSGETVQAADGDGTSLTSGSGETVQAADGDGTIPAPGSDAAGTAEDIEKTEAGQMTDLDCIAVLSPGERVEAAQVSGQEDAYFRAYPILEGDAVYARIYGKSYRENDDIGLGQLRYLKVLHYNFDHEIQVGELIVNEDVADDVLAIFRELFDAEYEIQSMYLVDNYWTGDGIESDEVSIEVNNSSAFNYREITGGGKLSNHALGRAIDINPQQNPYVLYRDGQWQWEHENATPYIDRESGEPHMILAGDLCCTVFEKYGFQWGGYWENPVDYQHFDREPEG